jgi:hypothetical protein
MELYEWDGPRQVLHFDHDTHAFTGVVADSLDSVAYLSALKRAKASRKISDEAFSIGLLKLRRHVAPTWHFSIDDVDPEFGLPMGDYFEGFIQEEARQMGKTIDDIKGWKPPSRTGKQSHAKTRRRKEVGSKT